MDDIREPYQFKRRNYNLVINKTKISELKPANLRTPAQSSGNSILEPLTQNHNDQAPITGVSERHNGTAHPKNIQSENVTLAETESNGVSNQSSTRSSYSKKKMVVLTLICILIIGSGGYLYYRYLQSKKPVFSAVLIQSVGFPIYYPGVLPNGYMFKIGSANIQSGLLYFKIVNGPKTISFTEQNLPPNGVNISSLPKSTKIKVSNGQAALGISLGSPSGTVVTDTTLIDLVCSGGATKADITTAIQKMQPVTTQ